MGLFEQNPLLFIALIVTTVEGWSWLKRRIALLRRRGVPKGEWHGLNG